VFNSLYDRNAPKVLLRYLKDKYNSYVLPIVGLNRQEITALFVPDRRAKVRAKQLADWIYRRFACHFDEMSDLPLQDRTRLSEKYLINPLSILARTDTTDGVTKILVHSRDHQGVEAVLLPYDNRVSCCLSSQVGCAMGCTFCATGLSGFDRNLTVSEIVAQYLLLQKISDRTISHVVFMGMGEPLLNYDALLKSIRIFTHEIGLSARHLTVSTVGIVPKILQLAEENIPLHLAISLHSPYDEIRNSMMPVNLKWPVDELLNAAKQYATKTKRKVTIEYLLIAEKTDTIEQAKELARLIKGMPCLVNLIPFNFVQTTNNYRRPSTKRISVFRSALEKEGINVTQRMERGQNIAAACGQLAGQHSGRLANRTWAKKLLVSS
jgi:23S rRNA (adenine2503-C2)-methyltransferase